jgi:Tn3 transposase DDE domain
VPRSISWLGNARSLRRTAGGPQGSRNSSTKPARQDAGAAPSGHPQERRALGPLHAPFRSAIRLPPKLPQAVRRYLFTVFGYGCNIGPNRTARHAPEVATAQTLRWINAQHINADKVEAAIVDVVDHTSASSYPRNWGSRKRDIVAEHLDHPKASSSSWKATSVRRGAEVHPSSRVHPTCVHPTHVAKAL